MKKNESVEEFSYDMALAHHVATDDDADEDRLDSARPWEAGFEMGEEIALEEQATLEANWDED